MKRLLWIVYVALIVGCGGGAVSPGAGGSEGTSGGGGAEAIAASQAASTGTGGSTSTDIGDSACDGALHVIAPIFGETKDANGNDVHEDGAFAFLRVTPPVYPWTATGFTYGLAKVGPCVALDHEAIAFVGPKGGALPQHPTSVSVATISASSIDFANGGIVDATIGPEIVVGTGEDLWVGVQLRAPALGTRTCVLACDGGGPDPASWYSSTNADGAVDACPSVACDTTPLSVSPDAMTAHNEGSDNRRWPFIVHGHD